MVALSGWGKDNGCLSSLYPPMLAAVPLSPLQRGVIVEYYVLFPSSDRGSGEIGARLYVFQDNRKRDSKVRSRVFRSLAAVRPFSSGRPERL
jgi:hypothetical protein